MSDFTFTPFPKISRLFRPIIITEKIDGTNTAVVISDDVPYGYKNNDIIGPAILINSDRHNLYGYNLYDWSSVLVYAQSRSRVISPEDDNFGFAEWVREHAHELAIGLGVGTHFGEWWGRGIQRGYGLNEKRFSLFNTARWDGKINDNGTYRPNCCHVVPTLAELENFDTMAIIEVLSELKKNGSYAAPGFMNPEGIVTYHRHSNSLFKTTIKNDDKGKEYNG